MKTGHIGFAECYIDGREFSVPFLCGKTLPVVEITYNNYPAGKPKILGQEAKWQPNSFESKNTGSRYEFPSEDFPIIEEITTLAERCFSLFKLKGWGRIDFRCTANGAPFIIDVNANSCLAPDAWFAGSLQQAGIDFDTAMQKVIDEAL